MFAIVLNEVATAWVSFLLGAGGGGDWWPASPRPSHGSKDAGTAWSGSGPRTGP